ncbi:MAG: signal peptidase II [Oscillospiraceae bacterium]|nr:signal peptidase II [Oscillospiraceae bacterium]
MLYLLLSIYSALIVVADQVTKYLTVKHIPLWTHKDFIPGFLGFTYTQNTGGGWSILSDHTWLLVVVSIICFALIGVAVWKKFFTGKYTLIALFSVLGGGIGNLIDRVRLGYVVDMIQTEFMDFPVFNVADCFISCGAIALFICVLLEDKRKQK